jgi:hypothetical protein
MMTPDDSSASPFSGVRWVRTPRISSATRTDGITLCLREDAWSARHPTEGPFNLKTPPFSYSFENAIYEVDALYPPDPWVLRDDATWAADVWVVKQSRDSSWSVYRSIDSTLEAASKQKFPSADRARRWAELRFDRGVSGLRGPKPRAGYRAVAKMPDVRVTVEERASAFDMLFLQSVNYSEFVRASLRWFQEHVVEQGTWEVQHAEDGSLFFAPKKV